MSFFSAQRVINVANPVNRAHALARDLVHWWICVPGLMGGEYLPDLMALPGNRFDASTHAQRSTTGASTYSNAPTWSIGTNRSGGFGHMVNPALTSPSGFMQCGDVLNATAVGTYDFSLIGFVNIITHLDSSDCIMGQEAQTGSGIVLFLTPSTHLLRFFMGATNIIGTRALLTETWYQVAVTWTSAASNLASVYINGSLDVSGTGFSSRTIGTPAWPFIISGNPNLTSAKPILGRFDDFRVYNRCLSADEVKAMYVNSLAGYPDLLQRTGQISFAQSAVNANSTKYRRTFSQFGTHSGGRQVIH